MKEEIKSFVNNLSEQEVSLSTHNMYSTSETCRVNLELYLSQMKRYKPTMILIGEAAGYKGCLKTGIPFTSEFILKNDDFFQKKDYCVESDINHLDKENTATIMWQTINNMKNIPLLWNIFPFHPYEVNNCNSNRAPTSKELYIGKKYLFGLLGLFNISKIGAVGRKPESILLEDEIPHKYLRHPSYGGKVEFVNALKIIDK